MKIKKGFTLIEIIIALVIIAVLVALSIAYYSHIKDKTKNSEAVISAGHIRSAELASKMAGGNYFAANTTEEINQLIPLSIETKDYEYRIVGVSDENFLVLATKIDTGEIIVAMDKDGLVNLGGNTGGGTGGWPTGGSTGGGTGGGTSGSTGSDTGGGFGGSSSGGGSSGGGSSGGGSSGGGSSGGGTGSGTGGSTGGTSGGDTGDGTGSGTGGGDTGGGNPGGGTPPVGGSGGVAEVNLQNALALLQDTTSADALYDLIIDKNISIAYADLGGPLGEWIPTWWLDFFPEETLLPNTIYISNTLKTTYSAEAIAAIIAHEANHADYNYNTEKWITATTQRYGIDRSELAWYSDPVTKEMVLGDSIDQEYNCFVEAVLFWKEKRGTQTNDEFDYELSLYEAGGTELYDAVASTYKGYPPYQKELK